MFQYLVWLLFALGILALAAHLLEAGYFRVQAWLHRSSQDQVDDEQIRFHRELGKTLAVTTKQAELTAKVSE